MLRRRPQLTIEELFSDARLGGSETRASDSASCSRKIPMIYSSLNRLRYMSVSSPGYGLYSILEEASGLTSSGMAELSQFRANHGDELRE